MNKSVALPAPWHWTDQSLTSQLVREISRDHILFGKMLKTLARRQDNDDVLFLVDESTFAVVHLTWRSKPHFDSRLPSVQLFDTWDNLYKNRILVDKENFE